MKLTVLGCSGSLGAPGNPASGYLVTSADSTHAVMDLGPGTLAALQQVINPSQAHVLLSHLHADHCLDFPSLMVWRRFHPQLAAQGRHFCIGPANTADQMGRLSSDEVGGIDDMSDTFALLTWQDGRAERVESLTVTPFAMHHPVEAYALRVTETDSGRTLVYSGDTGFTESLVEAARGAQVLLCEAGWGPDSAGAPEGMHMSGAEAGRIAALAGVETLVLTHIPPWSDAQATAEAARKEFSGAILLARPGLELEV
ncbi:MBL fold metallo-hydrolase [Corynebacterium tapiri]|uniref:MBL fold metallo-hydrolase n=1 Tax=Corynebacterium tapiri TaxID=1448266 RepID=A0A5C4U3C4_9CORY|nr:MBL fold metallo-hydrolase [Corynebacterium tapiri]TNL95642.1 MBL fold metallo-hydrolase [Corynebacterium tapiri]